MQGMCGSCVFESNIGKNIHWMCYVTWYKGLYAHFRTRATAVPCMQNMCTHVCIQYERSRDFIISNKKKPERKKNKKIGVDV